MADKMSIDSKPHAPAGGIVSNHHAQHHQHQHQHIREESEESVGSTPDQERHSAQPSGGNAVSQDQQQPKRKGGRKPVSSPCYDLGEFSTFWLLDPNDR